MAQTASIMKRRRVPLQISLGRAGKGRTHCPFMSKGLFAAFALKMARKRDEADALLGDLALVADPKLNMALRPSAALRRQVDGIDQRSQDRRRGCQAGNRVTPLSPAPCCGFCKARATAVAFWRRRNFSGCAGRTGRYGTRSTIWAGSPFTPEARWRDRALFCGDRRQRGAVLSPKVGSNRNCVAWCVRSSPRWKFAGCSVTLHQG